MTVKGLTKTSSFLKRYTLYSCASEDSTLCPPSMQFVELSICRSRHMAINFPAPIDSSTYLSFYTLQVKALNFARVL